MEEMEKMARVFATFAEADEADRRDYQQMTPSQRITMLLQLRRWMAKDGDESAERLERVLRTVQLQGR